MIYTMYDKDKNYMVWKSELIKEHQQDFIKQLYMGIEKYKQKFNINTDNITWEYDKYNVFSLSSGSPIFYKLYEEVVWVIQEFLTKNSKELEQGWIECWINNHSEDEVLDTHNHLWPIHGYICIEPQHTKTIFMNDDGSEWYGIENEVGNIYIGPGHRLHKVINIREYKDKRITLGFDFFQLPHDCIGRSSYLENGCISFIPIIFKEEFKYASRN